ncbi:unnamed protein product [Fusarium graminearum]|nr:unnamed protein product [Fusarium graminearum]CZS74707.1 unnamed protein product [Fusarium graminearum]VTO82791.1 unnamed protein product [Fusarium graminearum]
MSVPPAVSIALLLLTLFVVFAGIALYLRSQVQVFVRAIFTHTQEKRDKDDSTVANSGDTV